jgi:hypothetical protein
LVVPPIFTGVTGGGALLTGVCMGGDITTGETGTVFGCFCPDGGWTALPDGVIATGRDTVSAVGL